MPGRSSPTPQRIPRACPGGHALRHHGSPVLSPQWPRTTRSPQVPRTRASPSALPSPLSILRTAGHPGGAPNRFPPGKNTANETRTWPRDRPPSTATGATHAATRLETGQRRPWRAARGPGAEGGCLHGGGTPSHLGLGCFLCYGPLAHLQKSEPATPAEAAPTHPKQALWGQAAWCVSLQGELCGSGGGGGCCCCRCLSAFRKFILLQKSPSASLPSLLAPLSLLPELCHESHLARKGGDGSPAAKTQGHAKSPPSPTMPSPPGWQSRGQPCSQACCPAQGTSRHPVPAELGYEHAEAPVDLPGGPDSKRRDVLTFPWARMVPMPIPPTGRVHLCPRSPPTRTRTGLGMADPANRFGPHADRWPRCALCSAFCKPGIPCPRMQFPAPSQVTHT